MRHLADVPALFQSRPSHEPHRPPATHDARKALRLRRLRLRVDGPALQRWRLPHRYHQLIFRTREIGDPDLPEATRTPSGFHPGAFCFQRSRSITEHKYTRGSAGLQQARGGRIAHRNCRRGPAAMRSLFHRFVAVRVPTPVRCARRCRGVCLGPAAGGFSATALAQRESVGCSHPKVAGSSPVCRHHG